MEAALYGEGGFFASGARCRPRRAATSSRARGRSALRRVRRACARPAAGTRSTSPTRSSSSKRARGTAGSRARCCAPQPECLRGAALRARRTLRRTSAPNSATRLPLEPADEALGPFVRARRRRPARARAPAPVRCSPRSRSCPRWRRRARSCSPTSCSTTCRSGSRSATATGGSRCASAHAERRLRRGARPDRHRSRLRRSPPGTRVPIPRGMDDWWRACEGVLRTGFVLVVDYATTLARARRAARGCARTGRTRRGTEPLDAPGEQDITADVVLEQLDAAAPFPGVRTDRQADWLAALGIDELVDEGRRIWEAGAAARRSRRAGRPQPRHRGRRADRSRRPRRPPSSPSSASAARAATSPGEEFRRGGLTGVPV